MHELIGRGRDASPDGQAALLHGKRLHRALVVLSGQDVQGVRGRVPTGRTGQRLSAVRTRGSGARAGQEPFDAGPLFARAGEEMVYALDGAANQQRVSQLRPEYWPY